MKRYLFFVAAAAVPCAVWTGNAVAQSQTSPAAPQSTLTPRPVLRVAPVQRGAGASVSFTHAVGFPSSLGKTVSVDLNSATARDAFKTLLDDAKQEFVMDEDVPQDVRVTLRASNVRLSTALDVISQAAGVNWRIEPKDGKAVVRIGKTVPKQSEFSFFASGAPQTSDVLKLHEYITTAPRSRQGFKGMPSMEMPGMPLLRYQITEERSTFTCPHCKGQTTMLRQRQQPKCPKCERLFQASWQFCPVDGSKRPATPGEWKHCPLCGKQVDKDKGGKEKSKIELKEAELGAEVETEIQLLVTPPTGQR